MSLLGYGPPRPKSPPTHSIDDTLSATTTSTDTVALHHLFNASHAKKTNSPMMPAVYAYNHGMDTITIK